MGKLHCSACQEKKQQAHVNWRLCASCGKSIVSSMLPGDILCSRCAHAQEWCQCCGEPLDEHDTAVLHSKARFNRVTGRYIYDT